METSMLFLSPVLLAKQPPKEIKPVDPYHDQALLHFIIHKEHLPGRSSKQVERIERLNSIYSVDAKGGISIKLNDQTLKIPRIEKRKAIVEEAHYWGHFQNASTTDRLVKTYF